MYSYLYRFFERHPDFFSEARRKTHRVDFSVADRIVASTSFSANDPGLLTLAVSTEEFEMLSTGYAEFEVSRTHEDTGMLVFTGRYSVKKA